MALKALSAAYGWPYEVVSAQKWKRHFGIAADKTLALDCAGRLLPEDAGLWTVRRGFCTKAAAVGRAEASLIALFGIRALNGIAAGLAAETCPLCHIKHFPDEPVSLRNRLDAK
jgi:hypothetical protein